MQSDNEPIRRLGLEVLGSDLYGLAQTLAALTRGMVSIEDDNARVLAYSASDESADELRRLSILGRQGPPAYLQHLQAWGVYDQLRRSNDVVTVPADVELGIRPRLVIGMRDGDRLLGSIWVQEGAQPLAPESAEVLRGAAAVAARMIVRTLDAPNAETLQIERLLGARGGGVDAPSVAATLGISTDGPAVVIGFTPRSDTGADLGPLAARLRLHAGAYAADGLVAVIGRRIYLLLPRSRAQAAVTSWTRGVIKRIERHSGIALRAAIASPVGHLVDVATARAEVDRVLDQTRGDQPVTTLADSRTPVLLGEILDLVAAHEQLRDPRIAALIAYDARGTGELRRSLEAYLRHFGDVRSAAAELQVHPNTLRYRVRRAEEIVDIDLDDPAGRLLVELQLAIVERTTAGADRATPWPRGHGVAVGQPDVDQPQV